jgi:hypothetical protein
LLIFNFFKFQKLNFVQKLTIFLFLQFSIKKSHFEIHIDILIVATTGPRVCPCQTFERDSLIASATPEPDIEPWSASIPAGTGDQQA